MIMRPARRAAVLLLISTVAARPLGAGQAPAAPPPLTLEAAIEQALRNYPAIEVSQEQTNAAAAGIRLARTAYLPRIDTLAQVNRATRNNLTGLLLPQAVLPSISGPVLGTSTADMVWGSAIGALVSWEPFDFGFRNATVATAAAARARAEAAVTRSRFDVAAQTADAYLTLAAAQATAVAAQAGVDRSRVLLQTVQALVNAELRAGADASRAEAELAAAQTQLILAEQAGSVARTTLARFTGSDPAAVAIGAPRLAQLAPDRQPAPLDPAANPAAVEQQALVEQTAAQLRALERSYFPRVLMQGSAYVRGTGAEPTGAIPGGTHGLAPDTQNYAVGVTVTLPLLEIASLRAREAEQAATMRSEQARARQIAVDLRAQWNAAVATLDGARRVAANTPTQVSAARAATAQATARYQAGLGTLVDVADAQRLLTQAEIDDALARLSVWRALLGVAVAAGDLQPFVAELLP
jgi:outer membrane protein